MKKILFYIAQEYYWTSMEPIYREFEKDKNYELFIKIGPNHKRFLKIFLVSQRRRIEDKFKKMGLKVTDRTEGFDAVFCGTPVKKPERFGDALLCNVDHGPGIKTLRYRHFLKQPDTKYVCFLEGKYRIEKFEKYGLDKIEEIYDVGLPKLDRFFDNSLNKKKLLERFGLNPEKKIVLYAPSYKPTSIFMIGDRVALLTDKYDVVVKLHPYSWTGKYASHSQHRFFEKLIEKYPNLHLVPPEKHDIMPYMYVADTMISDGSSVINEFLALGRCGIIVDLPDEKLKHHDGQPFLEDKSSEWLKDSFVHISPEGELYKAVEKALSPTEERQKYILRDKNYIFSYTDGKSSFRVKQVIDNLLLCYTEIDG